MNESSISVRYAKALYQSASELGISKQVLDDMSVLDGFFQSIPEFTVFLDSPVVKVSEKLSFFKKITKDGFQDLSGRFLELITQNKRESFIRGMIRHYSYLYRKDKGIVEALLQTADTPTEKTVEQLRKLLKETYKADVEMRQETNPEIIGGFILRIEDQQLDASIAAQLQRVQRELNNTLM